MGSGFIIIYPINSIFNVSIDKPDKFAYYEPAATAAVVPNKQLPVKLPNYIVTVSYYSTTQTSYSS